MCRRYGEDTRPSGRISAFPSPLISLTPYKASPSQFARSRSRNGSTVSTRLKSARRMTPGHYVDEPSFSAAARLLSSPNQSMWNSHTPLPDRSFRVSDYLLDTPSLLAQTDEICPGANKENDPLVMGMLSTPSGKPYRVSAGNVSAGNISAGNISASNISAGAANISAANISAGPSFGVAGLPPQRTLSRLSISTNPANLTTRTAASTFSYNFLAQAQQMAPPALAGAPQQIPPQLQSPSQYRGNGYRVPCKTPLRGGWHRGALVPIDPNIDPVDARDLPGQPAGNALDSSPSTILLTSTVKKPQGEQPGGSAANNVENSPTPATKSHLTKPPCRLVHSNSALEPAMGLFEEGHRAPKLPLMATFSSQRGGSDVIARGGYRGGSRAGAREGPRGGRGGARGGARGNGRFQIILADMNTLKATYSGRKGKRSRKRRGKK